MPVVPNTIAGSLPAAVEQAPAAGPAALSSCAEDAKAPRAVLGGKTQ